MRASTQEPGKKPRIALSGFVADARSAAWAFRRSRLRTDGPGRRARRVRRPGSISFASTRDCARQGRLGDRRAVPWLFAQALGSAFQKRGFEWPLGWMRRSRGMPRGKELAAQGVSA